MCRNFKGKEERLSPILIQMRDSINSKRNNLNVKSIKKYLDKGNKQPVLVFFGGSTDKEIVVCLGLGKYTMLELTSYDLCDNLVFYFIIENIEY
ncbi:unnamed protein product [Macrosiphum euphorbiae]|uniref:Uncharacterized protein n=1 Tax=Macrosiphum euphorbiae TaxID=13131 RepID=A0AAV0Y1F9_9HEMI|nr:unnamed protein product [Macrosiphum euphorbiae]